MLMLRTVLSLVEFVWEIRPIVGQCGHLTALSFSWDRENYNAPNKYNNLTTVSTVFTEFCSDAISFIAIFLILEIVRRVCIAMLLLVSVW